MTSFFLKVTILFFGLPSTCLLAQSSIPKDFPKPVNTGNVVEDRNHYAKEKEAWIMKHPDEYAKMGGEIHQITNKTDPNAAELKSNAANNAVEIDLTATSTYQLVKIRVVDIEKKHTDYELAQFQLEAESEFIKAKMWLDTEKMYFYTQQKDAALQKIELNKEEECISCRNRYRLVSKTEKEVIIYIKAQDEGQFFVFEYVFSK
ncbi:MAG: hypothetical protein ACKVTZ_16215 [Bacteroidia bacterium]